MLRVGPAAPQAQAPEDVPEVPDTAPDDTAQEAPAPPDTKGSSKRFSSEKLDPEVVVYMDASMGPFQCSNCTHFEEPSSCGIVGGPIDPGGLCHVFTPKQGEPTGDDTGEPPAPDTPVEGELAPSA